MPASVVTSSSPWKQRVMMDAFFRLPPVKSPCSVFSSHDANSTGSLCLGSGPNLSPQTANTQVLHLYLSQLAPVRLPMRLADRAAHIRRDGGSVLHHITPKHYDVR